MKKIVALISLIVVGSIPVAAVADQVGNDLDATVDATVENLNLTLGGSNGSVTYKIHPTNGDSDNGCNLDSGSEAVTFSVASSNSGIATVAPGSVSFEGPGCGDTESITVTAAGAGVATISLTTGANNTGGTFDTGPATFTVTVSAPPPPPVDTMAPPVPTHVSPNDDTYTTASALTEIDWSNETDPSAPVTYRYESSNSSGINPDGSFVSPVYVSGVLSDSEIPTPGTPEGIYYWHVRAVDALNNASAWSAPWRITVDNTPPVVECGVTDGLWHADDVSITCSASDALAGLESPGDASFVLTTDVPNGTQDANASTGTYEVCDKSGNCVTAGPVAGNKVDKLAPSITITAPTEGGHYTYHQTVPSAFTCDDAGGSGVATCTGNATVDTSSTGAKSFTANATDNVGNSGSDSVDYVVDPYVFVGPNAPITLSSKDFKQTSTIPVKFRLLDVNGQPVSWAAAKLDVKSATSAVYVPAIASGGSNSLNNFRYDPTGTQYIYNLSTKQIVIGTTSLKITLDDGSAPRLVSVVLK